MDFWNELHSAAEAVRTGGPSDNESPELSHLPPHVREQLMAGAPGSQNSGMSMGRSADNDVNPPLRNIPDHLKNNPYANLSRQELLALYEKMK